MSYHACPIQLYEIDPDASHVTCWTCRKDWRIESYRLVPDAEPIRHLIVMGGDAHGEFCPGCAVEVRLDEIGEYVGLAA